MEGKKPKLLVFNSNYPNEKNQYGDVFVHSRLKHYSARFEIQVLGWKKDTGVFSFEYEGIKVDMVDTKAKMVSKFSEYKPDAIGFHFIEGWMYFKFVKRFKGPAFIWIHGVEALGWYRRLFLLRLGKILIFLRYMVRNTIQMIQMHFIIRDVNKRDRVKLIFVSKWMRKITEMDSLSIIKNPVYIPNPIDTSLFKYRAKAVDDRKKILLIRSFNSKKYANDIAIDAILHLAERPFFNDLCFSIYGVGDDFHHLTKELETFSNVSLHNRFVENKEIPEVHSDFGIFLCPTRQDAQGVSMCEAMSSGLVPITSFNTAIPEFVEENVSGFMTTSAKEIADKIEFLYHKPIEFLRISELTSKHIQAISSTDFVVNQEISMIEDSLNQLMSSDIK